MSKDKKYGDIFNKEIPDVDFLDILKKSVKNDGLYIGITDNVDINKISVNMVPNMILEAFEDKEIEAVTVKFYRV